MAVASRVGCALALPYLRNPVVPRLSSRVLRVLGATICEGARIKRSLHVDNALTDENSAGDFSHFHVGEGSYVGDGVYVDLADEVRIREHVTISGRCAFITHADCNRSPWLSGEFPRDQAPVTIEEGAWIGFGATIMPGVTVASESVVAAGAVVTEDTEPRTVSGGVPAETIRDLDNEVALADPEKAFDIEIGVRE